MSDFRFEEPPAPKQRPRGDQTKAAQALKERPGEWGMVTVCRNGGSSSSMARAIRKGASRTWQPAGDFEAVARKVDGEYRVYARYMPDPERSTDE
ncbi:hypothetical protein [Streptomyces sp. enrichment culture]|uniref:hypothetical protein n=1 Tax=Streptomyces sp. enrichment culture TaxID=1795815 RepID=UPI003F56B23E